MTTFIDTIPYTPEEIARRSEHDGKRYELFDGQLVEKPMSLRSNGVAAEIVAVLRDTYPKSRAYIFVEQPTFCFVDPRHMRIPDVALVWAHRLPAGLTDDELQIPPDLAVEVVSPTNTYNNVHNRVDEYLNAGVGIVWVVGPVQRDIYVYRSDGTLNRYRKGDDLRDEALLPGLTFKVGDLFPAAPPAAASSNS
jgi:Uma2 family endonuclease